MKEEIRSFPESFLPKLLEEIRSVRYGSVTIVIQNGKVVQIEKREKTRLL